MYVSSFAMKEVKHLIFDYETRVVGRTLYDLKPFWELFYTSTKSI